MIQLAISTGGVTLPKVPLRQPPSRDLIADKKSDCISCRSKSRRFSQGTFTMFNEDKLSSDPTIYQSLADTY